MYLIDIYKKTFVKPLNGALHFKIYDENNCLFWSSEWVRYKGNGLTLPQGRYRCTVQLVEMQGNKNDFIVKKKPIERDLKHDFREFNLIIEANPNKCTINHIDKTIKLDPSFLRQPKYVLEFVIMHEKGHNFYNSEFGADIWAVNAMLNKGYTPHQIMRAPFYTLSGKSLNRKLNVIKKILKSLKNEKK